MVKEGLITNGVLAKALERQIIFGGRLGTNLVEMGAINEETLARFLSKVLRVPYAEPASFEDVSPEVLEVMPRDLAEKYTAFPIRRERTRLHVAMKDPNDIAIVDELRFIVGLDIRPYIASEMRIVFALEKYYGVKRDLRYVAVKGEEHTFDSMPAAAHPPPLPTAPLAEPSEEEYLGDESQSGIYANDFMKAAEPAIKETPPPSAAQEYAGTQTSPTHAAAAPAPPARPSHAPAQAGPLGQATVQQPTKPEPPATVSRPASVAEANPYHILASPDDREQLAGAVVSAAKRELARAALFMVKGPVLTGWRAAGQGLSDSMVTPLQISLAEPTLFKEVVEDMKPYKGPILALPQNQALLTSLGGAVPLDAVAFPLVIKGKVVGALYGDNGEGKMVTGNLERLGALMVKASMSLEILILKTKILAGEQEE